MKNMKTWLILFGICIVLVSAFPAPAGELAPVSYVYDGQGPGSQPSTAPAFPDPEKKKLIKKVVFIGDSITCGVGVGTPSLRFSTRVIEGLKTKGQIATEINLGKSGSALCDQGVGYPSGVLLQEPGIVIVQWGVNDHYWGYSVPQFIMAYDRLVSTLRKANPELQIVLCTLISDFRWPDSSEQWICEANIAIQELAVNYRCHLADLHKALSHDKAKYYSDTIHPNQAGAQAIADDILRALSEPVLSETNQRLSSDLTNGEIRFLQNVFTLGKGESGDDWIEVTDITKNGMKIKAGAPVAVRTTLQGYQKGTYRVEIKDPSGMVTDTQTLNITKRTVLKFLVKPVEKNQTMTVSIN